MIRDTSFVVLDFETTGLSPRRSEVIEVGAVQMGGAADAAGAAGARIGAKFDALCRPCHPIPPAATHVHGITNDDVAACRPFAEHLPDLLRFLEGRVLVAHHARFDLSFLRAAVARDGLRLGVDAVLCTVRLSRRLFPELARHDLQSLCLHHGIRRTVSHRALADACATAELLGILLERAEERGVRDGRELCALGAPAGAARRPTPVRLAAEDFRRIEDAIVTGDRVSLEYVSRRGVRSHRSVVPYVVASGGGTMRLVAYDVAAGTTRTFRLDRVDAIGAMS